MNGLVVGRVVGTLDVWEFVQPVSLLGADNFRRSRSDRAVESFD